MGGLRDGFGRKIDYLRISVTDRCHLRCFYCMPEAGISHKPHKDILTFEEIVRIVAVGVSLGIDKIRLTGGEPLVREGLVDLVSALSVIKGLKDISLTTNGILLKEYAQALKKAGLKRINVSLDSLKEARYKRISRGGDLEKVIVGIEEAIKVGFIPLKINVLLLDDLKKEEIVDFLRLTIENSLCVRFLELMPVTSFYLQDKFISSATVMEIAEKIFPIEEIRVFGAGPAEVFKFKHALGSFGFISPMSNKFCSSCNRLRLSSDGILKPCLHSEIKVDLRQPLRQGRDEEGIRKIIEEAVKLKPKEHALDKKKTKTQADFFMCSIGG